MQWHHWYEVAGGGSIIASLIPPIRERIIMPFLSAVGTRLKNIFSNAYQREMLKSQEEQISKLDGISTGVVELKAFLYAMLQGSREAIYQADLKGSRVWKNNVLAAAIGCEAANLDGDGWLSYVHEDDREKVAAEWNRCMEYRRVFNKPIRFVRLTGGIIRVQCTTVPMKNGANWLGWYGSATIIPDLPMQVQT